MIKTTNSHTLIQHPRKLKLKEGVMGHSNDPYGWSVVYVELMPPLVNAGASASWYTDGLGACRLELTAPDGRVTRREELFSADWRFEFKAKLLFFKQQVGITPVEAEEGLYKSLASAEPDPMGPMSRYI